MSAHPLDASVAVEIVDAGTDDALASTEDADGNDDPEDPGNGVVPASGHFTRIGRTWASLKRICDLTPFAGALYAAHANAPLGVDGATITRYVPAEDGGAGAISIAFDWNRSGEPTGGGGAGQGFVRVRAIDGRLYVPDADPPYDGFGLVDQGTEGYMFVSDEHGVFAKALNPAKPDDERTKKVHFRPPKTTIVIPRAYHDIDVIRFHGKIWASTGSVPPTEHAWHGSSPGALHALNDAGTRLEYVVGYPPNANADVWRLTYMVRFRGKLLSGIQEYYPREPNDYVAYDGSTLVAHKVTSDGGAETLRWYADRGKLYWIALEHDGRTRLRVTRDGGTWTTIAIPDEAGAPADIVRFRDGVVVLTERRLFHLADDGTLAVIAQWDDKKLFAVDDFYCAPPLAVFQNALYAGGQKDGALYRLD